MREQVVLMRQRQAQEAGDLSLGRNPLQEALARVRGLVDNHVEHEGRDVDLFARDLAKANLAHLIGLQRIACLDELAQIRLLATGHDVDGGNDANHARDACERWCHEHVARQQPDEVLFRIGPPLPRLVSSDEPRTLDENARIELDLIGLEGDLAHETRVVSLVIGDVGPVEIRHEMRVYLETEDAQKLEGPTQVAFACMSPVKLEHVRTQALHANLHLRATERAQMRERWRIERLGARLDDQPDNPMRGFLVDALLFGKLGHARRLPRSDILPGTPEP